MNKRSFAIEALMVFELISHLFYSSTSTVQRLEISRVESLEISRFCTLEISRHCFSFNLVFIRFLILCQKSPAKPTKANRSSFSDQRGTWFLQQYPLFGRIEGAAGGGATPHYYLYYYQPPHFKKLLTPLLLIIDN